MDRHVFKLPGDRDLYEGSCEELRKLLIRSVCIESKSEN
ncbi:Fur-regulated basic protein FbpA [Bacillus sp. JJ927]